MTTTRTYSLTVYAAQGRNLGEHRIEAVDQAEAIRKADAIARAAAGAVEYTLEGPSNAAADAWYTGKVTGYSHPIIDSARIYGAGPTDRDGDGDLSPTVVVEIDHVGCYGDLPRPTRARIERAIERRLGLVGWSCDGGEATETGEVWTYRRPAHRPRRDPSAARVNLTCRVHPDTRRRLDEARAKSGEGLGELIDRLAATLDR